MTIDNPCFFYSQYLQLMKKIVLLLMISLAVISCNQTNTSSTGENESIATTSSENIKTIELNVSGMTCTGCENTIESALTGLEGVVSAEASHTKSIATISFDSTKVDDKLLSQTINNIGYHVVEK